MIETTYDGHTASLRLIGRIEAEYLAEIFKPLFPPAAPVAEAVVVTAVALWVELL